MCSYLQVAFCGWGRYSGKWKLKLAGSPRVGPASSGSTPMDPIPSGVLPPFSILSPQVSASNASSYCMSGFSIQFDLLSSQPSHIQTQILNSSVVTITVVVTTLSSDCHPDCHIKPSSPTHFFISVCSAYKRTQCTIIAQLFYIDRSVYACNYARSRPISNTILD